MRMLLTVRVPHEPFNTAVREGTAGPTIEKILEDTKPEAVYFTEHNGTRGAVLVVNVSEASQVPFYAEPWFLKFNADCEFRVAMSRDDLKMSGLEGLGKKWK